MDPLLQIKNLKTCFYTDEGVVNAVNDINMVIHRGETVGLVGESGCGKSVLARSIMRLIPDPPGKITAGEILYDGQDLLTLPEKNMRNIRGDCIAMIFQDPMASLNPVLTIGNQICEAIVLHQKKSRTEARKLALNILKSVSMPVPEQRIREYPHQLSGGMQQRVMIAIALSCSPDLLIADEPTTALDVTVQAQILELLADLKTKYQLSMLLVTHDLGVVAEVADSIVVMYAGECVEQGKTACIFSDPGHPYTKGLLNSMPSIDAEYEKGKPLDTIEGSLPDPMHMPAGCYFEPRCPHAMDICLIRHPQLIMLNGTHRVRCFLHEKSD